MSANAANGSYPAPDDYAIIVGINRYRAGIDTLCGAVNDAKLFYEWATSPTGGGLDPAHATLITSPDNGPFDPSRDDIESEIIRFYEQAYDKGPPVGRRLYLFMAGHGVAPADGDDCSLVAANSPLDPYWVLQGRLTADRVRKQPFFNEVVLFMSCCRNVAGNADFLSGLPKPSEPLAGSNYLHGLAVKWAKRAIEKKLPHPFDPAKPPLWQSIFAHALLKGLIAATDDTGRVTSLSLKDFVKKQMQAMLPSDDNRPPDFFLDDNNPPIIFRDVPRPAPPPATAGPQAAEAPRDGRLADVFAPSPLAAERSGGRRRRGGSAARAAEHEVAQPAATLATSGLTPVEVHLSGGAATFEILDGVRLTKLDPPVEQTPEGAFKVHLKPSLYAFRVPGGSPAPIRVLGEALRVDL